MATEANAMSSRLVRREQAIEKPPRGLIAQVIAVVVRPRTFFRVLPHGRSWLAVGILILFVVGFTSTRQISTTTRSLTAGTQTAAGPGFGAGQNNFGSGRNFGRGSGGGQTSGTSTTGTSDQTASGTSTNGSGRNFAPPSGAETGASGTSTTGSGRNFAQSSGGQSSAAGTSTTGAQAAGTSTTGQQAADAAATGAQTTQAAAPVTTNSTLMNALLAAGAVLLTWAGEAILLSLVPMLRGFKPQVSRGLQIAIWASVPLAIMLILRQVYFAAGGTGGMTGLSLLLTRWSGYSSLPELVQRVLTTFMSNLSLFWVWGLLLLYFGAREALRGRRWTALVVVVMWVTLSTIIPALVSQPVTNVAPRVTTSQTASTGTGTGATGTRSTTATGAQTQFGGGNFTGGNFGAGGNFGGGRTTGRPAGG